MIPRPVNIYRITHFNNLAGVLSENGIWPENVRVARNMPYTSIAHANIQGRRCTKPVPCGPDGTVNDYVPWYFATKSPMLYALHKGSVQAHTKGQAPIIYFRSTVEAVGKAGLHFVFTDGHAIMFNSKFYDDLGHLDRIDWPLMKAKYWHAISSDPDRPRRRQAEFLVHEFFPFELVEEIGVMTQTHKKKVEALLQTAQHKPIVNIRADWYY